MGVKFFGQYLLEKGKITPKQLLAALSYQKEINQPIGAIALEKGYLSAEQIRKIHLEQRRTDKKFGEIAIDFGYITKEQLDELLKVQAKRKLYLGEALVKKGFLSEEELDKELKQYWDEQERDELKIDAFIKEMKNSHIVEAFIDLIIKMHLRLAREIVKISNYHMEKDKITLYDYTITQRIEGDIDTKFIVNFPNNLLLKIASELMRKEQKEVNELVIDACCEFVNIVTGNACSKLSTEGIRLRSAPPLIFDNSEEKFTIDKTKEVVVVDLLTTIGPFNSCFEF